MRIGERKCRQILAEVARERYLNVEDLLAMSRKRKRHHVAARAEIIRRMREVASVYTVAAILQCNISTVEYHLSEKIRARRSAYFAKRNRRKYEKRGRPSGSTSRKEAEHRHPVVAPELILATAQV